jgi:trigger factor
MQVVEKSNEGLSRVIAVTIPVAELNQKLDAKLKEVAPQMKLKGFRPGKVPMSHVKKTFGRDLMGEIVNDALNTSSQKALDDAKVRPAAPAEMKLTPTWTRSSPARKTWPMKWPWKSCPTSPRPTSRS